MGVTSKRCLPLKALVNRSPGQSNSSSSVAGGHGNSSRNRPTVALQENAGASNRLNAAALPKKRSVSLMDNPTTTTTTTTWRRVAESSGSSHDENSKENGHARRAAPTRKKKHYKKKQQGTMSISPPKPVEATQEQDGVRDLEVREDTRTAATSASTDPVTVSCAARLHSEVYLRVTGEHLAEVEKVLQAVSPSIQVSGRGRHQYQRTSCRCLKSLPSVSLGALWDWYECPSSYGVELFRRKTGLEVEQESVYEFFETEQPQQRLPLLQKIGALTGTNSSFGGTGDSSALRHALIADLDPLSWFAVA